MPMRSHVDPCTFVVYIHVSGARLSSELIEHLERVQPVQGESDRAFMMIESHEELLENLRRGEAIYVVVYKDGNPDELFCRVFLRLDKGVDGDRAS